MQINTLWRVVRTLIVTYVISAVLLAALSFALFQFHLREPEVNAAVNAVYILSCLLGGLIAGKTMKTRRFLWGLLIGLLYFLFLFCMSMAQSGGMTAEPIRPLSVLAMCALSGMAGGMSARNRFPSALFPPRFSVRGHLFPGQTSCPVFYLFPNFASR